MVDGTGLENRHTLTGIGGSNPSLSATSPTESSSGRSPEYQLHSALNACNKHTPCNVGLYFRTCGRNAGAEQRLLKRKPFLLHGQTGVGKTLLIRSLPPQMPAALYSENSATTQVVFRSVAQALLELRDQRSADADRGDWLRGWTGFIIAGALLWFLLQPRIRTTFT